MGEQTVLLGLRANGEEFPIEASISQQGPPGHKLYTVILRDVTGRVANERALRQSREELRELAAVSHAAREQERARVARELHDEVGGALTALKMDTAWILERLQGREPALADKIATMQKMLDNTVAATRRMSSDLRPMMLDDLGLVPAVEWLVHEFQQRTGIVCELAFAAPDFPLSSEQATACFRILQESLTNITKHAGATQVEVTLEIEADTLILTVRDNGSGFDAAGPRPKRSYGLMGIRERAYLLGGNVRIDSNPGEGTVIEARLPLEMTANETTANETTALETTGATP
jgi:signal transduction histidine kinase